MWHIILYVAIIRNKNSDMIEDEDDILLHEVRENMEAFKDEGIH